MHWIASHILKELAVADTRTYSELIPDGVDGNLFQYHARTLEREAYIVRSKRGYELSGSGRTLVGTMSLTRTMRRSEQPQPVVMIYAENEAGETLLFRWRRQPYRGSVSLPFGRLLRGRSVGEMAAEQLRDKAGLAAEIAYLGLVSIQTTDFELVIMVVKASNLSPVAIPDGLTGTAYWGDAKDVVTPDWLPGQTEVIDWIKDPVRAPLLEVDQT